MTPSAAWIILRQLVRDTFRQSRASGIFWMMLVVTSVCVLLCLSVRVSGDVAIRGGEEPPLFRPPPSPWQVASAVVLPLASTGLLQSIPLLATSERAWRSQELNPDLARREGVDIVGGRLTLAFGAVAIPIRRDRADAVRTLQLFFAGGIADTLGLLLALIWTAGFLPTFLEPAAASVLLAKPVPRWALLLGKYVGVLAFVAFQAILFVGLTWLALAVRTGVWEAAYLWSIPLLLLQFAVFFSFSVLIAVSTRSTVACVLGSILFWFLGWGMNYAWIMIGAVPESQAFTPLVLRLVDLAYWISPKPIDLGLILFNALDAQQHFAKPAFFQTLETKEAFSPEWSILSSLSITAVVLGLSTYEFSTTDY